MENMNEYSLLADRITMIYATLNELTGRQDIDLITGSDITYFENVNTQTPTREINRHSLINLDPIDLVRVITGLYNDVPCNCED